MGIKIFEALRAKFLYKVINIGDMKDKKIANFGITPSQFT